MNATASRTFPRGALLAAAGLLAFTLGSAALGRHGGVGVFAQAASPALEERHLRFSDREDGAVVAVEAGTNEPLAVFDPGTNGFVRGALRGLVRERKRRDIGPDAPFVLALRADERLVLQDPTTGAFIDLAAFGPSNVEPFVKLMTARRGAP